MMSSRRKRIDQVKSASLGHGYSCRRCTSHLTRRIGWLGRSRHARCDTAHQSLQSNRFAFGFGTRAKNLQLELQRQRPAGSDAFDPKHLSLSPAMAVGVISLLVYSHCAVSPPLCSTTTKFGCMHSCTRRQGKQTVPTCCAPCVWAETVGL